MVRSMTGFGRCSLSVEGRELTVELKSVNHRFLDVAFRMTRSLSFLEDDVRRILSAALSRGHVDVYAYYRNMRSDSKTVSVDKALLGAYLNAASDIVREFSLDQDMTVSRVLRLPDIVTVTEAEEDNDALREIMTAAVTNAVNELIAMRVREGERISADLISRLDTLSSIRDRIAEKAPTVVEDYRERLNARIESLLSEVEIDRARLATEIALFADRANIDEELVRLSSHFTAMRALLTGDEPAGRKLDFLVQEMNREFNTIGSKANDKTIASLVIDGKAELEKLREQVQNLE